jgi:hypothetical protein
VKFLDKISCEDWFLCREGLNVIHTENSVNWLVLRDIPILNLLIYANTTCYEILNKSENSRCLTKLKHVSFHTLAELRNIDINNFLRKSFVSLESLSFKKSYFYSDRDLILLLPNLINLQTLNLENTSALCGDYLHILIEHCSALRTLKITGNENLIYFPPLHYDETIQITHQSTNKTTQHTSKLDLTSLTFSEC